MAKTTCKKFTYAKYSSGGDGAAIVYTGGTMLDDYLAKVDITEDRTDEKEYADGAKSINVSYRLCGCRLPYLPSDLRNTANLSWQVKNRRSSGAICAQSKMKSGIKSKKLSDCLKQIRYGRKKDNSIRKTEFL